MPANERDLAPCSERATRGYPALSCELDPSKRSKPVQLFLLLIGSGSPGPIAFLLRSAVGAVMMECTHGRSSQPSSGSRRRARR